ncbi:MAG: hypothetical protein IPK82_13490 [Polyangiaceae bacterium]|nr:hypothetical protein [Polyangiaceae bacterium]
MVIKTKPERVQLLFQELTNAAPQSNEPDVLRLIEEKLDIIEDAYSGVPKDPKHFETKKLDGRLYAPHPVFKVASRRPGCTCYRQAGHKTYIAANGAFRIVAVTPGGGERVVFDKAGADGKGVPD